MADGQSNFKFTQKIDIHRGSTIFLFFYFNDVSQSM
jgi:hypothetical protein